MTHALLRKKIRDVEFYIVRNSRGEYVINDNKYLDNAITNRIYSTVGQAYNTVYDYIVKGVLVAHNDNHQ